MLAKKRTTNIADENIIFTFLSPINFTRQEIAEQQFYEVQPIS